MKPLKLKALLIEHSIKQKDLAAQIGVTPVHFNYILNGERRLPSELMAIIVDVLEEQYGITVTPAEIS